MEPGLSARMFHALVVMGAALGGGCGPVAAPSKGTSSGDGSSSSTAPVDPSAATTAMTATSATPGTTTSAGTTSSTGEATTTTPVTGSGATTLVETTGPGPIDSPDDCAAPQQFKCTLIDDVMVCACDADAPLGPEDCDGAGQFYCAQPWLDPPIGCFCNPDAPRGPDDCASPNNYNCQNFNDPTPAQCRCDCEYDAPNPQGEEDCLSGNYWCAFEPFGCCCFPQIG